MKQKKKRAPHLKESPSKKQSNSQTEFTANRLFNKCSCWFWVLKFFRMSIEASEANNDLDHANWSRRQLHALAQYMTRMPYVTRVKGGKRGQCKC